MTNTPLQQSIKAQGLRLSGMKKMLQAQPKDSYKAGEISNRLALIDIQQEQLQKFITG